MKKVKVISENESGRNIKFQDQKTKEIMTRSEFVQKINRGFYNGYYVRKINDVQTPVSKPNGKEDDNLG